MQQLRGEVGYPQNPPSLPALCPPEPIGACDPPPAACPGEADSPAAGARTPGALGPSGQRGDQGCRRWPLHLRPAQRAAGPPAVSRQGPGGGPRGWWLRPLRSGRPSRPAALRLSLVPGGPKEPEPGAAGAGGAGRGRAAVGGRGVPCLLGGWPASCRGAPRSFRVGGIRARTGGLRTVHGQALPQAPRVPREAWGPPSRRQGVRWAAEAPGGEGPCCCAPSRVRRRRLAGAPGRTPLPRPGRGT